MTVLADLFRLCSRSACDHLLQERVHILRYRVAGEELVAQRGKAFHHFSLILGRKPQHFATIVLPQIRGALALIGGGTPDPRLEVASGLHELVSRLFTLDIEPFDQGCIALVLSA